MTIFRNEQDKKRVEEEVTALMSETFDDGRVWIFQGDPSRYDILHALTDPELKEQHWQVNQYRKVIKKMDIALIWISGKDAGLYAVAEVISNPAELSDYSAEEKYWINDADRGKRRQKVAIKVKQCLVNNPVLRSELRNIGDLKGLSILNFSRGTNFPVRDREWVIIKSLIQERGYF